MKSPYLNTEHAALYLDMVTKDGQPDRKALRHYLLTHRVPTKRRGSTLLVHIEDLEASLKPGPTLVRSQHRRAS